MDMNRFKSEGNTDDLKAKDYIGKNFKLVINKVDTVTYEATDNMPENTRAVLYFEGREKRLVLNGTNAETLCDAFGDDSDRWIGREISLATKDYTAKGFGHGWIVAPIAEDYDEEIPF